MRKTALNRIFSTFFRCLTPLYPPPYLPPLYPPRGRVIGDPWLSVTKPGNGNRGLGVFLVYLTLAENFSKIPPWRFWSFPLPGLNSVH